MPKIYGYTEILGDILITGSFSILGSASTIYSTSLVVSDTIISLGHSQSGSPILDEGIMFGRGTGLTQAFIWDESDDTFALVETNDDHTVIGDIGITGYSSLRVSGLTASQITITSGATSGAYLISDSNGLASWTSSSTPNTSGTSGTTGTSGTSGAAGSSGTSGTSGAVGSSGTSGTSGANGAAGSSGTSGTSGVNGAAGSSGTSGANGAAGSSGTSGTSGVNGAVGSSGTSGTTGTSGSSGTSGAGSNAKSFGIVIDGGGSDITTGIKSDVVIPFNMTITSWTIVSSQTGSIVVDVWKSNYSSFPPTSSIAGTEKPTLSSQNKNQDLTLTTWTTTINAGDIIRFNVDSCTGIQKVTLSITGTL
jgi:hypothetical protein